MKAATLPRSPGTPSQQHPAHPLVNLATPQGRLRLECIAFAAAVVVVALGYALYTNHVWEDYFITFRHSRNLAEGKGLVFVPGERVHGFTSPLGTLLPALCYLACGSESHVPSLWLFRAFSIAALAGAGVLVLRTFQEADGEENRAARVFFAAFFLLQGNIVDFSINGMETGFMMLFLAWGFLLVWRGIGKHGLGLGLCWAGLMWTRPDGCVYIVILSLVSLLFRKESAREVLAALLRAAGVCTALYLPWFAWAWWYYGSPVPHTIIAKADPNGALAQLASFCGNAFDRFFNVALATYLPVNADFDPFSWHPGMVSLSRCLGVFAALYWVLPTEDRLGRLASACFALLVFYLATLRITYSWYLPPATLLALVVVARGVLALPTALRTASPRWRPIVLVLLTCLVLERGTLFALGAVQLSIQQIEIEDRTRTRLGLWLRAHGKPEDTIFLEPVGYIGYFSGMRIADDPGLVSPAVVRLRRSGTRAYGPLILALRPEWAVLRPVEAAPLRGHHEFDVTLEVPGRPSAPSPSGQRKPSYKLVKVFDATQRVNAYGSLPGKGYLANDAVFYILRRTDLPPLPPDPNPVDLGPGSQG